MEKSERPARGRLAVVDLAIGDVVRVTCGHGKTLATLRVRRVHRLGVPTLYANLRTNGEWAREQRVSILRVHGVAARRIMSSIPDDKLADQIDNPVKGRCTCTFAHPNLDT